MTEHGTTLEALRAKHAAMQVHSTMMDGPLRLTDILKRSETIFAEREVVTRRARGVSDRLSFAELGEKARRLSAALTALKVQPGARVATLMWNNAEHAVAYFGIPAAGAVLHALNPRMPAEALAYIVADAGDDVVIVDHDLLPLLRQVEAHVRPRHVIVCGPAGDAGLDTDHDFDALLAAHAPADWPSGPFDEGSAAAICYTSGTTGRPKGVVYSHRSILLHALGTQGADYFGLGYDSVAYPLTPMFHVNAWGAPYSAVMAGATLVLPGAHIQPDEILDQMLGEGVTVAFGVPTFWNLVLGALDAEPGRWSFEVPPVLLVGGAAPSPELVRGLDRHGITLQAGWGMTETSPIATMSHLRGSDHDLSYIEQSVIRAGQGMPLPCVEFRVALEDETTQPWDGTSRGELQVRGPWITAGYIGHPEPKSATTSDGWLKTGDMAVIHPNGRLQLVDRLKDLIKSGGEWISSVDLENAIADVPGVAEVAVIAKPDPKWDERPLAVVRTRTGEPLPEQAIHDHLLTIYPRWMLPDEIVFAPEIPKTGTGKFDKVALRRIYAA